MLSSITAYGATERDTNRSSTQQLLIFLNSIHNSHQGHASNDVFDLDFKKAFYKVSHSELLLKL